VHHTSTRVYVVELVFIANVIMFIFAIYVMDVLVNNMRVKKDKLLRLMMCSNEIEGFPWLAT
jgi:hypothetical protein